MMLKLTIGIVLVAASAQAVALTGTATERLDVEMAQDARAGSLATSAVLTQPVAQAQAQIVTAPPTPVPERALSANPLWGIPLTTLSGTRDRPIFSQSRRPPAPSVAPAATSKVAVAPKPRERDRPQLNLVGTIVSGDEGFGIFLDQSTKGALRLRIGEDFQGWKLRSVQGREAILEKDQQVFTLELPHPGLAQPPSELRSETRPVPASLGKLLR
jgi:hypothetical protein